MSNPFKTMYHVVVDAATDDYDEWRGILATVFIIVLGLIGAGAVVMVCIELVILTPWTIPFIVLVALGAILIPLWYTSDQYEERQEAKKTGILHSLTEDHNV